MFPGCMQTAFRDSPSLHRQPPAPAVQGPLLAQPLGEPVLLKLLSQELTSPWLARRYCGAGWALLTLFILLESSP